MKIDVSLVQSLVATQFPQWRDLPIRPVARGGWDNRTFHFGNDMLARMPSAEEYASQVEKEQQWLPKLAPLLPLQIPIPLAMGEPGEGYPWKWSIYRWLDGEMATLAHIEDLCNFASRLAHFLLALQAIDKTGGPLSGAHSFYRGGPLITYDAQTRQAIRDMNDKIDVDAAAEVWDVALTTSWQNLPVWVHGDLSASNMLVQNGVLKSIIDFGHLAVGDPACDLTMAWTFFTGKSREIFRETLNLDAQTWARARGWALWKALITVANPANTIECTRPCWLTINEVLKEHKHLD